MVDAAPVFAAAFIAVVAALPYMLKPFLEWKDCYLYGSEEIGIAMPSWAFLVIWPLMYALAVAAQIVYIFSESFCCDSPVSMMFEAILSLWLFNIVLTHHWRVLFFKWNQHVWAGAIATLMFLSTAAMLFLYGFENFTASWIAFGLYGTYMLWNLYLMILNWVWVASWEPPVERKKGI